MAEQWFQQPFPTWIGSFCNGDQLICPANRIVEREKIGRLQKIIKRGSDVICRLLQFLFGNFMAYKLEREKWNDAKQTNKQTNE